MSEKKEYIERGALDDAINENRFAALVNGNVYTVVQVDAINSIPAADVVEVVRCKDCIYPNKREGDLYRCCWNYQLYTADWFCKHGKRKDGDAHD